MESSVVAQGQRGTRRACAIVAAAEQQIESLGEAVDFLVDLLSVERWRNQKLTKDDDCRHRESHLKLSPGTAARCGWVRAIFAGSMRSMSRRGRSSRKRMHPEFRGQQSQRTARSVSPSAKVRRMIAIFAATIRRAGSEKIGSHARSLPVHISASTVPVFT